MSEPKTPSMYETALRIGDEADEFRRELSAALQRAEKAEAELSKWERFKTDDATLTKLKAQSKDSDSLAAQGIYIAALETALTRYREAEKALPEEPQLFLVTSSGGIKVYHEASAPTAEKIAEKFISCHDYDKLRAHAAAVTAERDALKHDVDRLLETCTELATENERLREDAERWAWWRTKHPIHLLHILNLNYQNMDDKTIDEATETARKETP